MEEDGYKRFEFKYGIILLRTKRFQSTMDRLGANRVSKPLGWFLLYVMPVAAAIGFYLFLSELGVLISPRGVVVAQFVRTLGPLANLGLPGINPYLPVVDGWIALFIAMIIHEGAHGIVARSLGLPVKASGLLFFLFVPIGAFVDVEESALREARPSYGGRVLAAGAGVNLVAGLLFLLLLISVVSSMVPAADGVPIAQVNLPSPASLAGIKPGDFLTSVNGVHIDDAAKILNSSWYHPGVMVTATVWSGGTTKAVSFMVGARPNVTLSCDSPMVVGAASHCILSVTDFLGSVSGDNVTFLSTGPGGFNSTSCRIMTNSCGVVYTPSSGSGSQQNITGNFRGDAYNLFNQDTQPVTVESTATGGHRTVANVTSANNGPELSRSRGYIGTESVSLAGLRSLVSSYSSPLQSPWQYVCIPTFPQCQSRVPFSDSMSVFYTSPLGALTIPLANLSYWIFFLNFNLAIFNALPIYPLDGGQAFSVGLRALGKDRLSENARMRITSLATLAVVAMLFAVIAGPYFL